MTDPEGEIGKAIGESPVTAAGGLTSFEFANTFCEADALKRMYHNLSRNKTLSYLWG